MYINKNYPFSLCFVASSWCVILAMLFCSFRLLAILNKDATESTVADNFVTAPVYFESRIRCSSKQVSIWSK